MRPTCGAAASPISSRFVSAPRTPEPSTTTPCCTESSSTWSELVRGPRAGPDRGRCGGSRPPQLVLRGLGSTPLVGWRHAGPDRITGPALRLGGGRDVDLVDVRRVPVAAVEGDRVRTRLQPQLEAEGVHRVPVTGVGEADVGAAAGVGVDGRGPVRVAADVGDGDRVEPVLLDRDAVELELAAEVEVADLLAAGADRAGGDRGVRGQG